MNADKNTPRKKGFTQVCVWPGTSGVPDDLPGFTQFFVDEFKTRVQFLEEIVTAPDHDARGRPVPKTGGRTDVFFAVHKDDIGHFAVPRFKIGVRWIEDVLDNEAFRTPEHSIYPTRVVDYRTW